MAFNFDHRPRGRAKFQLATCSSFSMKFGSTKKA